MRLGGGHTQITVYITGDVLNVGKAVRSQTAKNASHCKQTAGISTTQNAHQYWLSKQEDIGKIWDTKFLSLKLRQLSEIFLIPLHRIKENINKLKSHSCQDIVNQGQVEPDVTPTQPLLLPQDMLISHLPTSLVDRLRSGLPQNRKHLWRPNWKGPRNTHVLWVLLV